MCLECETLKDRIIVLEDLLKIERSNDWAVYSSKFNLSPTEAKILQNLMKRDISHDDFLLDLTKNNSTGALKVHISSIRRELEKYIKEIKIIRVWTIGYCIDKANKDMIAKMMEG